MELGQNLGYVTHDYHLVALLPLTKLNDSC